MMKKHYNISFLGYLGIISSLLMLISCERELEYRGKETQPLMVVSCLVQDGDSLELHLSHSRFFLDNAPIKGMTDADVQYQVNGGKWQSMGEGQYAPLDSADFWDYGYFDQWMYDRTKNNIELYATYQTDYICRAGDEINITIRHKDYQEVTATQVIVPQPQITASWQLINNDLHIIYHLQQGNLPDDAIIQIATEAFGRDYYCHAGDTTTRTIEPYVLMSCFDPILSKANNSLAEDDEIGLPLSGHYYDWVFNIPVSAFHGTHDLDVILHPTNFSTGGEHWVVVDSVYAHAMALSNDYYRYVASREQAGNADDFGGFFAEKVQIHSNIDGGIGIFGSCNETLYTIDSINAKVVIKSDLY